MNPGRWKQIDELFDAVLDLPEAEREAFLSEKCDGDDKLKREVLSLLEAQGAAENEFMRNSAMNLMAQEIAVEKRAEPFSLVGKEFGVYKIEKQIGAGGMGEVYLAQDTKLDRNVALKILPPEFLNDAERLKRFEREARTISALNHPYIVTIYDFGKDADGVSFIATEYVEGETLRDLIKRGADLKQTLSVISQTCEALAAAHSRRIVHRDIKPENIMIRADGYVKVLDFGLAKLVENADFQPNLSAYTQKGMIIGTPSYMSPAQVLGERVDHRTDLWSVGVYLYEMLAGANPFKGATKQETFQKILSENPPPIADLPLELNRILEKALEKDADLSYQTASDFRADLKRVRREMDSSSSLRNDSLTNRREDAKTRKYFLPFAVLLFTFAAFGVWYFAFRHSNPEAVDWSKAKNVQLTDQEGAEIFPSLAPDGKSFVYAARREGNFDIFVQRVGGKNAICLTENERADDTQPAFSPDGEHIAFRSGRSGVSGIYVMGATGENVRRVSDFGFHPSWSPDGKEIVVSTEGRELPDVRNPKPSSLWIITVETGAKRLLLNTDAMHPSWSPDGKFVAYWFYPPNIGRRDIGIVSAAGGEPLVITNDGTTNWNPVWSPDGKFLYFASDRAGNMSFWRVRFEDGKSEGVAESVITPAKYSRHLAFSRDGKRLIYVSTDNKSNIQAVEFDARTEKTIGEPFWITRGDREISRPELSPDGTKFVFRLSRRTQDDIVVMNRDGTNQRDLTNDAAFDRYPRWSPDGKRIAFASDRSGNYEIWTINADGTNLKQITFTNKDGTSFPIWSPDGTRLLYRCNPRVCIIDLAKNWSEQTLETLPDYDPTDKRRFIVWDWSPDGMRLAGSLSGAVLDAAFYSFPEKRFENLGKMDSFPMFLPDSRRLIYGFENRLMIADTDTKKTRELDLPSTEEIRSIGISRDGKLIYYTIFSSESNIWLLDTVQEQ